MLQGQPFEQIEIDGKEAGSGNSEYQEPEAGNVFNLTEVIPLFAYLTTFSPRIKWYRTIMRVFLRLHREYRYQLTEEEIRDEVQRTLGLEYTVVECAEDLEYLKKYGNVTTIYDASKRATSIASFLRRTLLYQATPEAIDLETFLDAQLHTRTASGSLDQSNLPLLYRLFVQLDERLERFRGEVTQAPLEMLQPIAEDWQNAFRIWDTLARNAAQYLRGIASAAQQGGSDFDAFQMYKTAVVSYVKSFAQALSQYSRDIRELLQRWEVSDKHELLILIVAQHIFMVTPDPEGRDTQMELALRIRNQVESLTLWFAEGRNTDTFRRNATAEVEKVVRRATSLSLATRANMNYAAQLHVLAGQLLETRDAESAQQLFTTAFAGSLPVHFSESLAGFASVADRFENDSVWEKPPVVTPRLWPLGTSNRGERRLEDPMPDQRRALEQLKARYRQRDEDVQEHFARLFYAPEIDIAAFEFIEPESRMLLEEILDICLGNSEGSYEAQDGGIVTLLNREEQRRVALKARDGILYVPRYRLRYAPRRRPNLKSAGKNGR